MSSPILRLALFFSVPGKCDTAYEIEGAHLAVPKQVIIYIMDVLLLLVDQSTRIALLKCRKAG